MQHKRNRTRTFSIKQQLVEQNSLQQTNKEWNSGNKSVTEESVGCNVMQMQWLLLSACGSHLPLWLLQLLQLMTQWWTQRLIGSARVTWRLQLRTKSAARNKNIVNNRRTWFWCSIPFSFWGHAHQHYPCSAGEQTDRNSIQHVKSSDVFC